MSDRTPLAAVAVMGGLGLAAITAVLLTPPTPLPAAPRGVVDPAPEPVVEAVVEVDTDAVAAEARLLEADARVAATQAQLTRAERALAESRRALVRAREQRGDLDETVARLQATVARRQADLDEAARARDELLEALVGAVAEAEASTARAVALAGDVGRWRNEALDRQWAAFVAEAQVAMCDRGGVRRQERCADAVATALDDAVQTGFVACVRDGWEVPRLARAGRDVALPDTATRLTDDPSYGRSGWYVASCDPSLPEAEGS